MSDEGWTKSPPYRVRIAKGVRPYGGRRFIGWLRRAPNGREYWEVNITSTSANLSFMQRDIRTYQLDEVEIVGPLTVEQAREEDWNSRALKDRSS